jgi:hypothetical protein
MLKPRVMRCLMKLTTQVEQYDLNGVDDEDAPCDALRTIVVGDVRPQEVNEDQPSSN